MEPFFLLWYYGGMTWAEYYTFPISYRRWLIKRINEEIKKYQEAGGEDSSSISKAPHHNNPQTRQLTGKVKPFQTNARTWKPT